MFTPLKCDDIFILHQSTETSFLEFQTESSIAYCIDSHHRLTFCDILMIYIQERGIVMKNIGIVFIICLSTLIGCQPEAKSHSADFNQIEDSYDEGHYSSKNSNKKMEISIDGQQYTYSNTDYPILSSYARNFKDPEEEFNSLSFQHIVKDTYIVTFACHHNACSHLMIDFNQATSFLLSDLSKMVEYHLFPEQNYVGFLFERELDNQTKNHQLKVINVNSLQPVELELKEENYLIPRPNQFQYPIYSVNFNTNQTITIKTDPPPSSEETGTIKTTWIYK